MTTAVHEAPPRRADEPGDPFRIFDCARIASEEGRMWVEENLCERAERTARCSLNSVGLMRRRRVDEGREMLDEAEDGMARLRGAIHPAMYALLERWYSSALAYYLYARKDLDGAEEGMIRAQRAVVEAISLQPLVIPFATGCSELHMNRARIAATRRRWGTMKEHLDTGVRMGLGRMPFCTLADGTEVWQSDVQRFIRSLPSDVTERWEELPYILDNSLNERYFDRLVRQISCMTNLAIQYP
jgi:hypothetical protein